MLGKRYSLSFTLLCSLLFGLAGAPLGAADTVSQAMKQILDHRSDDFASIRTNPHDGYGETDYASKVVVPGAKECYIRQEIKPRYADGCDVADSKNRSAVLAKYARYVKDLRAAAPTSWISWTEEKAKPGGEATYVGPDRSHPAAKVGWVVEGMNANYFLLSVTFYAEGYVKQ